MQKYRDQGAIGALLDEYEKALRELQITLSDISPEELTTIADPTTQDPDCKSIQTILGHVVRSGYGYAIQIRRSQGEDLPFRESELLDSTAAFQEALDQMFIYNVQCFSDYPDLQLEQYDPSQKMLVRWGQLYDVEQLMEHAIVHILRHRRQIERFLIKMRD